MPDILPTEDCRYFIRYYEIDEVPNEADWYHRDDQLIRFDVYDPVVTYSGVRHYRPRGANRWSDYDPVADVSESEPDFYCIGEAGRPDFEVIGRLHISRFNPEGINNLFERIKEVLWAQCAKIHCRNCKEEYLHMGEDALPDPEGGQGVDCAVYLSMETGRFFGAYGSSKYDFHALELTCKGQAMLRVGQPSCKLTHGPYCDRCIVNWVKDGILVDMGSTQ